MPHHSVGPLLERGIREKIREEIERIVLETIYSKKMELRDAVDMLVNMAMGGVYEYQPRNEEEARDIILKEIKAIIPNVKAHTETILKL